MTATEKLATALERLTRWVGKGIADGAYERCVCPKQADADLDFAMQALEEYQSQSQEAGSK